MERHRQLNDKAHMPNIVLPKSQFLASLLIYDRQPNSRRQRNRWLNNNQQNRNRVFVDSHILAYLMTRKSTGRLQS
jgi:hypothetical protein